MFPFPIIAPSSAGLVKTYIGGTSSTTNATVYTFTSHSIGVASSDRYVVVCAGGESGSNRTISGITCGGASMTQGVQLATAEVVPNGIYYLNVTSDTTADIVVTFSGSMVNCRIEVYTMTGLTSSTPQDTLQILATDTAPSGAIDFKSGGCVIAFAVTANDSTGFTWTNITEDADVEVESGTRASAASIQPSADSTTTITATPSNTVGDHSLCSVSWK